MKKQIENAMYLAQKRIKNQTHYYIRETFQEGPQLKSRVLFDLGTDPAQYIIYPGGKGYYFDEVVEDTLREHGLNPTQDELDGIFWAGMPGTDGLQAYLRRYVILYFDHAVQRVSPIPRYLHEFMNRHRTYRPPKKVRLNMAEASRLFETTWKNLRQMDSDAFTRLYRKQALKFHPDHGGSHKTFVKLTKLYENLMKRKGQKPS